MPSRCSCYDRQTATVRLPDSITRPEALATLKARFHDAIAHVVLAQPHLHVGVVGENSKDPALVRLDRLDLGNHVEWKLLDDSSYLESLYLEVIVLYETGAGSMEVFGKFYQHLLRNLNESLTQTKNPILKSPEGSDNLILGLPDSTDKLPPNPELLSSWPMTLKNLIVTLCKELKPWISGPGNMHATWAPIQTSPFTTRFRNFKLENDTVKKVVEACRLHNTTLTSLIQALILNGFASRTPYDLRHFLPSKTPEYPWLQLKESMCNYVSVVVHDFNTNLVARILSKLSSQTTHRGLSADLMDTVWSVAARVRREIRNRLGSGLQNDLIGIMKFVSDWRTQRQGEARRASLLSWLVTNLGVIDGGIDGARGQEDGWLLRKAELVLSTEVPLAAFSVSIMTVKGGDMCVTCSWQDCVVDAGHGKCLMGDLEQWLKEIGSMP
ncbi:hypothetical protein V8C34DRAFT_319235 [Trichoderma compactum]